MSLAPVITSAGIVAPTYAEILASLQGSMRSIYGSDIYIDPDSQDGQMLAIIATAIHDSNDAIIAAYNSFAPTTAQGTGLSNLVKLNGIRRLVPTNSQAVVTIVGVAGTLIQFGQVADVLNQRWSLPPTVLIPNTGTIDVTAIAVDPGDIQASPGTITQIATPVRGWQTVTNAGSATPGQPVEDDATLRQRQAVSTAIPALSVLDAILGGIKNLTGVGRAFIYENATGAPDANGIPGHTICAVVEGGDVQAIASTIALYKTPGTGTFGTESQTVIDPAGISSVIHFDVLVLVDMAVLVLVTAETGFVSTTGELIAASVAEWMNTLAIGQDSQLNKLWSPVNLTGDAATTATGQTQAQLDALGNTYNATAIYQARSDMVIQDGPFAATATVIHVTNPANYTNGKLIAVTLDNGDLLLTSVVGVAGVAVTMANAIPAGRSAVNGALVYVSGDVTIAFNEAAAGDPEDVTIEVS